MQWKRLQARYPPKKYSTGDYTHLLEPLNGICGIYDKKKSFDTNWLNLYRELKGLNQKYDSNIEAEHNDLSFCIHLLLQIMSIIKYQPHLFDDEIDSSEWDFVVKFWGVATKRLFHGTSQRLLHGKSQCLLHGTSQRLLHGKSQCLLHGKSQCLFHGKSQCLFHGKSQRLFYGKSQRLFHGTSLRLKCGDTHLSVHDTVSDLLLKVDLRILHDRIRQKYNVETDIGVFEAAEEEPGHVKFVADRCKLMIENKAVVVNGVMLDIIKNRVK